VSKSPSDLARTEVDELRDYFAAKALAALQALCDFETPLTQDKWDDAREVIAEATGADHA